MSASSSLQQATPTFPEPLSMNSLDQASPRTRSSVSPPSSGESSSASESEQHTRPQSPRTTSRRSRMDRPRIGERQRSNSIIVPKGRDVIQLNRQSYPPDDARAMSPRRNSEDIERLERGLRESLKEYAKLYQLFLQIADLNLFQTSSKSSILSSSAS